MVNCTRLESVSLTAPRVRIPSPPRSIKKFITLANRRFFSYTNCMNQSYVTLILWIVALFFIRFVIYAFKAFTKKTDFRYKPKGPYLLSKGEKRFFDALIQSVHSDLYICPKVRVADLIEVDLPKGDKRFWALFNKISKKHVDFVLCSRVDFSPQLVIELDGGSHNTQARSQRDIFVDEVFTQAGIPILHVSVQSFYDQNQIITQVQDALANIL